VPTFTIDPEDAKDFDDALSFRWLQNGNAEVGVHIADVTHYVRPGTALDKEALERSTSVYLVDRVLPMLPEKLSNELCSLRPNEDSLCFSAIFEIDDNSHVVKRWFGKTIIHSDHRFSYEMAQEVMDKGSGPFSKELKHLNKIATVLRKRRMKNGSLMFETDEVRFQLDEHGVPIEIFVKERGESHLLIEDLMLLANREVATYMSKKGKGKEVPFVYRIHDLPDPQKLAELALFAKELGFEMKVDTPRQVPKSFNALARAAEECEALKILEPIAIRTMAKAEYHTTNIGHYGLAFAHYTHFTSPIRRYADVLVHRILEENLRAIKRYDREELQKKCSHISSQERKAQKAERNSIKFKQAEYLEKHVGEVFEGYVTGLIDRGIFVQLKEIMAEGLVGFDKFSEPFDLDESRLRATGRKTGQLIKMGDQVIVRILGADPSKRQIELQMIRHGQ
jgi:ribonuclease R